MLSLTERMWTLSHVWCANSRVHPVLSPSEITVEKRTNKTRSFSTSLNLRFWHRLSSIRIWLLCRLKKLLARNWRIVKQKRRRKEKNPCQQPQSWLSMLSSGHTHPSQSHYAKLKTIFLMLRRCSPVKIFRLTIQATLTRQKKVE